jgi:hypothetical protein
MAGHSKQAVNAEQASRQAGQIKQAGSQGRADRQSASL